MSVSIGSEDSVELRSQLPVDQGIKDFGPLPREHYPLVAVLMLAEPDARDKYNIVSPAHADTMTFAVYKMLDTDHVTHGKMRHTCTLT